MKLKKIKLNGDENKTYSQSFQYGQHSLNFQNGVAVAPEHIANAMKDDDSYNVSVSDFDPDKDNAASYYFFRQEGNDVAKHKENLSLDNVADDHSLDIRPFPESPGRHLVNNYDSTVKIVNPNMSVDLLPDEELHKGAPLTDVNKDVAKTHEERSKRAEKKAQALRDAYEGSQPARDDSFERGTLVRAPLDNIRTANPAQKKALEKNEELSELVEYGPDAIGAATADEAEEETGVVKASKRDKNAAKNQAAETKERIEDHPELYSDEARTDMASS